MNNANLKITSCGDGWQENLNVPCRVERGALTRVFYDNGGDGCELVFDGDLLKMSRRGKTFLDMVFKNGKRTICTAGDGGLMCELECFTDFLVIRQFTHGIRVKLKYTLSDSRVSLEATIIYNY